MQRKTILIIGAVVVGIVLCGLAFLAYDSAQTEQFNKKFAEFSAGWASCPDSLVVRGWVPTLQETDKQAEMKKAEIDRCATILEGFATYLKENGMVEHYVALLPKEIRQANREWVENSELTGNAMRKIGNTAVDAAVISVEAQVPGAQSNDPCKAMEYISKFNAGFVEIIPEVTEADVALNELKEKAPNAFAGFYPTYSENMLGNFKDGKEVTDILLRDASSLCTLQTEIVPHIDEGSDIKTIRALEPKLYIIKNVRVALQKDAADCKTFVLEKPEASKLINLSFGGCATLYPRIEALEKLEGLIEKGVPDVEFEFSGSQMFTTIYEYSDLLKPINPIDPNVRSIAAQRAAAYEGDRTIQQANAIFIYARDEIKYVQTPLVLHQQVQSPSATLKFKAGNCADKSVLLASMMLSVGFPVRIVIQDTEHDISYYVNGGVAFSPNHALVNVQVDGNWYYLDPACTNCQFGQLGSAAGAKAEMNVIGLAG
ncbi:MAG: transglutaminase family protein [Candidatus Diapherotrites archaeon]